MKSQKITFLLNSEEVSTSESPAMLVLDYLRRRQGLMGTKEGCKEGDCGACVVLVGTLTGNKIQYNPITSCLMPLGELHGKHLVTIEGLNLEKLTPIQKAIVDEGGSQCGFCTPGIVVSLTGYLINAGFNLTPEGINYALGGNLCRCTGYASLKRAGAKVIKQFSDGSSNGKQASQSHTISELIERKALPAYFKGVRSRLKKIPAYGSENGRANGREFIAGGTDIYVQKGEDLPDSSVTVLNMRQDMKGIAVKNGQVHVGALTTFEEFASSRSINKIIPEIKDYMHLNASWQIRNRATLGGNIVNASPIGDMTIFLLALDTSLILQNGKSRRTVPMKSFFKGYKKLAKRPAEILTEIVFPRPTAPTQVHFEKLSKRKTLDIASVNSAIKITTKKDRIIDAQLTVGGVAPIPLFLKKTSDFLESRTINAETVLLAVQVAMGEISPISDIRGSADYKRLLVRQFLIAHFTKLFPAYVTIEEFYEAH